jgi:hypothetical protein
VLCLCTAVVSAQDKKSSDEPAKYVCAKLVSQLRDIASTAPPDMYWIAGSPITGKSDHVTIVTFHDGMVSVEKMWTAFDKVFKEASLKYTNLNSAASANSPFASHTATHARITY